MIINDGSYAPNTTVSAPNTISSGTAVRVKRKFAQSTDISGVVEGLRDMVDSMMNMEPGQTRANGRYVPPPEKRWKR